MSFLFLTNKNINNKGFTLLEMMAVIFFVSFGLTAIISLLLNTVFYSYHNYSRFIAAYLAQEGIEIVRNIRDTNYLKKSNWRDGLNDGAWQADYLSQDLTISYNDNFPQGGNFLKLDDNGFYNYNSGVNTIFKRKITISSDLASNNSFSVLVEVAWREKNTYSTLSVKEILYNWR